MFIIHLFDIYKKNEFINKYSILQSLQFKIGQMNEIIKGVKCLSSKDDIIKDIIDKVGDCKIGENKQNIFSYLIGLVIGQKIRFSIARKIRGNIYIETKSYNFSPNDILNLSEQQWKNIGVDETQKDRILQVTSIRQSHASAVFW